MSTLEAPKYCSACGRPLRYYTKRLGYDEMTGLPIYESRAKCTIKFQLLQIFLPANHDEYGKLAGEWHRFSYGY